VIALKRRIDAASAEFGSNIAVRAVEWHSKIHRVHGWEREISRVSLPTIPDLRQGINNVLGDCFLLLSHRWHDVLLAEVRKNQGRRAQLKNIFQVTFLLNDAYGSFASRFPAFTGSVSIVAHSLGCSIVWELLSTIDSTSPSRMRWPLKFRSCSCFQNGVDVNNTNQPPLPPPPPPPIMQRGEYLHDRFVSWGLLNSHFQSESHHAHSSMRKHFSSFRPSCPATRTLDLP
jgi:hypothetical protein